MVTIASLWLAILLSAVFVWIASAIAWMVLPHHKSEYARLPDEEAARAVIGRQDPTPGQYGIPHMSSMEEMKQPQSRRKFEQGPVAFITVLPRRMPPMGRNMALSFLYYLTIGFIVAYLTTRTLTPGTHYLAVFRVAGTVAWLAYGTGVIQDAIWFGRPWSAVVKHLLDSLAYALLTAGVFGWLWPR
jgi:hypothetical protein